MSNVFKIFVVLLASTSVWATDDKCRKTLTQEHVAVSTSAQNVIAYLQELLAIGAISNGHLKVLLASENNFLNPISENETLLDSGLKIHRDGLAEASAHLSALDLAVVVRWAREQLGVLEQVVVSRAELSAQTVLLHAKPAFVPIENGKFKRRKFLDSKEIAIAHDFELMDTLVPQEQWIELMGDNPSHRVRFAPPVTILLQTMYADGRDVLYFERRPVESVSAWGAMEFANKLSRLKGLVPAYDFSDSAQKNLAFVNNTSQNIYETEGYRLPTNDEWDFIFSDRGRGTRFSGLVENPTHLEKYAWIASNSKTEPKPVATREPFLIDGKAIYDFLGNGAAWVHIDAVPNPQAGEAFGYRGLHSESSDISLDGLKLRISKPQRQMSGVGFRLVRTTNFRKNSTPQVSRISWLDWLKSYIKF